jgi:hypothetical protein
MSHESPSPVTGSVQLTNPSPIEAAETIESLLDRLQGELTALDEEITCFHDRLGPALGPLDEDPNVHPSLATDTVVTHLLADQVLRVGNARRRLTILRLGVRL